ncbi:MAG: hypothetical protein NVSMB25_02440 [Thermoleophilaceae bacterium]
MWIAAAIALSLTGCGGAERLVLRPAAEPAIAPAATTRPAGRAIHVRGMPEGIALDPVTGLLVVGVREPPAQLLLDAACGRVRRRIALAGAPRHLQIARPGGPVLVPEEGAATLAEVELPSGRLTATHVRTQPHDATAASGHIFVGNEFGRSLSVIARGHIDANIGGLFQPGGVASLGAQVAVIDVQSELLSLFDARSLRASGVAVAGAGPTHVVYDGRSRLYVVDTRGGALLAFTGGHPRLVSRVRLEGAPYGIALDNARRRLWVTLTARNTVAELDLRGRIPRLVATYATARQPNSAAVDERDGRVFVADRTASIVQVVEPQR